ncbi:MAG: hypothetical protein H0U21_09420 [Acidimicrobiia bacterium]|nr:hypothetical protein [Acidimicrobiia bacterium]
MATVQIAVPDAAIAELAEALALLMGVPVPATGALKADLFRQWVQTQGVSLIRDLRSRKASAAEREKPPDEALNW